MTAPVDIALTWSPGERTLGLASGDRATLDDASAQALIDHASRVAGAGPIRISVTVPAGGAPGVGDLEAAIRAYFARRRDAAQYRLRRTMRMGWVSLAIGGALLVGLISLVEAIRRFAPEGRLSIVLQEGLTIVGWVALWRPVELLLYDRWSLRRDVALLDRLARADVHLVEPPLSGAPPRSSGGRGK